MGKSVGMGLKCVSHILLITPSQFNVLWLNPGNNNSFPPGVIEALMLHNNGVMPFEEDPTETVQSRMRKQMQAHALQPLGNENEDDGPGSAEDSSVPPEFVDHFTPELLEETTQFLRLQVRSDCGRRLLLLSGT